MCNNVPRRQIYRLFAMFDEGHYAQIKLVNVAQMPCPELLDRIFLLPFELRTVTLHPLLQLDFFL